MLKAKPSILKIFCSNKETRTVKKKKAIGLICKKTICTCSTRFCTFFLPLFCTTTTWNFQKLPGYPLSGGNLVRVLVQCFFCFSRRSCLLRWKQAFLIFSPLQQNFTLFLQQKMFPFLFFSLALVLSLVELRWPVVLLSVFSVFLRLSLYSKFVGMTINLSLILQTTPTQKHFTFSVFVFLILTL